MWWWSSSSKDQLEFQRQLKFRQKRFKNDFYDGYRNGQREFQKKTHAFSTVVTKTRFQYIGPKKDIFPLDNYFVALESQFITCWSDAPGGYLKHSTTNYVIGCGRHEHTEYGKAAEILIAAGAKIGIKANNPVTMMSLVGYNDIFGQPNNYYSPKFATGGSSVATMVAGNCTEFGVGTDIWGGVRVPAAWNGVYALKMSGSRWPMAGTSCGYEGIKGILPVASPLARSVKDLRYFIESVFKMEPWKRDLEVVPHPWREVKLRERPNVGILIFEDFLPPTPAQARAFQIVKDALSARGCELISIGPLVPIIEYDELIHKIYYADGFEQMMKNLTPCEHNDPHVARVARYSKLPRFLQILWEKILNLFGYTELERMYRTQRNLSGSEELDLLTQMDILREKFSNSLKFKYLDFLITLPHPSPAVPIGTEDTFWTILYTSLFNLLDYPAGIVPVSKVDKELDKLPSDFDSSKLSYPAKVIFDVYNSEEMEGLPTAVQVVTPQHRNEEALAAMEFVVESLEMAGIVYEQPDDFTPEQK